MNFEKGFIKNIRILSYVVLPCLLLPHPCTHIHTIPFVMYTFRMLLTKRFLTHLKHFKHMSKMSKMVLPFLALLCATAQQSYCRHAGVRRPSVCRPSVKPVFSEPVRHIKAKFGGKVPLHHISRPFSLFFKILHFCFFYDFFFCFR